MTRKELKLRDGKRTTFQGAFVRYGKKPAYRGPDQTTLLLKDVAEVESGEVVTDHLWFNLTKGFAALGELSEGDIIQFDARVKQYQKGYAGRDALARALNPTSRDYRLSHPTKIEKVGRTAQVGT